MAAPEGFTRVMKVAVNARMLLADRLEGIGWYTHQLMSRIAPAHPEHEFLFLFDRPYHPRFVFADNVKPLVLAPPARHPLLWYLWFEHSVRRALARHGADVFFSPDGFLSLQAVAPTVLTVHDLAFERFRGQLGPLQGLYCRRFTPAFVHRARRVVTSSEFSKRELIDCYGTDASKVEVIPCAAGAAFRPRSVQETQPLVDSLTGGAPFFLHVGAIHPRKNVTNLLRGFDRFKTETECSTKLLLSGRLAWMYRDVLRAHAAMRHRDDVIFLGYRSLDDLALLTASAVAVVCVSLYEGFGLPLVEAMAADCAVICSRQTALAEVAGGAALLVDPLDPDTIAGAMRQLSSAPRLRDRLIRLGRQRVRHFDWDQSAARLWHVLESVAGQRTPPADSSYTS